MTEGTTSPSPARSRSSAPGQATAQTLTEDRLKILRYLASYRFGTTNQIKKVLQPGKAVQHTLGDLAKLREFGFIKSYQLLPDGTGGRPELCWLLLRAGAQAIGKPYHSGYSREPNRTLIDYRSNEIDLQLFCDLAGWKLIRSIHYNQAKPLPKETPQYEVLADAVKQSQQYHLTRKERAELARSGKTESSYYKDKWREWEHGHSAFIPPRQANDYVAFRFLNQSYPLIVQAVVIILPTNNATKKFWATRMEQYKKLIKELPILAVFPSESEAQASRPIIEAAKPKPKGYSYKNPAARNMLRVTTLNKIYDELEEIKKQGQEYSQLFFDF